MGEAGAKRRRYDPGRDNKLALNWEWGGVDDSDRTGSSKRTRQKCFW